MTNVCGYNILISYLERVLSRVASNQLNQFLEVSPKRKVDTDRHSPRCTLFIVLYMLSAAILYLF